ncbi:MAG: GFA family protein [Geminicoccaceae bacterium]
MATQIATGHCLCGAIRFRTLTEPLTANYCHCESCRRHTGSAAASFVSFPRNAVEWSGKERVRYRSSPPVVRSFCGRCGSPLAYEHDDAAEQIDLYLGAFDNPAEFPPRKHTHCRERVAWFDTTDHAPRYQAGSDSGEAPTTTEPAAGETSPMPAGQIPPILSS